MLWKSNSILQMIYIYSSRLLINLELVFMIFVLTYFPITFISIWDHIECSLVRKYNDK